MRYFDNSVASRLFEPDTPDAVATYLLEHRADAWGLPATVAWEYLEFYESESRRRRERRKLERHFQEIAPLTLDVASEAATIANLLGRHDVSLNAADLLHFATARANDGVFVTADAADFDRPRIHELATVDVIPVD